MDRPRPIFLAMAATALLVGLVVPAIAQSPAATAADASRTTHAGTSVPHYNHIVVLMDNSEDYNSILGYKFAPTINTLARQYGTASRYYTTSDPDAANILALLAGNDFGIDDHLPYWDQRIPGASLLSQLNTAHLSWKEYVQNLPYPGYLGDCYPSLCQETDTLYNQQKFNSLADLASVADNPAQARRMVPDTELATDARKGKLPNFSFVVPSECYDMHGGPPWCEDSPNLLHQPNGNKLIAAGDGYIRRVTREIMAGPQWRHGNNAIVLTFTEGDNNQGCCDVHPGTGHVLTVVITSHGPRHLVDPTPFNHYSLLLTIEDAFGLHCLRHSCDSDLVPMAKLFGAQADPAPKTARPARIARASRRAAPHAAPAARSAASPWKVVPTPDNGPNDNDLAAIAGRSPSDVWAVGGLLPNANATIVQTLALHYNGKAWSRVMTPDQGSQANSLYGVTALPDGTAWATGIYTQESGHTGRALTEHWARHHWRIVPAANPGSADDILYAVAAVRDSDVWAVGTYSGAAGRFHPLIEHWNGRRWAVSAISGIGSADGILTSVSSGNDGVWAVGQRTGRAPDRQVILHLADGRWRVVSDAPVHTRGGRPASAYPQAIAGSGRGVWIAGNDRAGNSGFSTLVESPGTAGKIRELTSPDPTPQDNYLYGIAPVNGGENAWAVGDSMPVSTTNANSLFEYGSAAGGWKIVPSPNPGAANGNTILSGVVAFGPHNVWAAGEFDGPGGMRTLIMHYTGRA